MQPRDPCLPWRRVPEPSSKATLWVKAQHEGALTPPCIVWKNPQVPKLFLFGLTLRNELSEKAHMLTKQETLLGRDAQAESRRLRETRRTALPHGVQSQVL